MAALPHVLDEGRRRIWARLIANGIGQAGAALSGALALRHLLDHYYFGVAASGQSTGIWKPTGVMVAAAIVGALLKGLERADAERLGQGYALQIRRTLFDHLSRISPRQLQQRRQGGLVLRFVGDMAALRNWASRGLARLWVAGVMALGVVGGLFYLNVRLGLVVVVVLLLGGLASWATSIALDRRVRTARRRQGQMAVNINEKLARLPVVQAYGQRSRESHRIARQSSRLERAMVERAQVAGVSIAIAALTGGAAVIGLALVGATHADVSRGTVIAAITLFGLLTTPLHQLGRTAELWRSATVSREKMAQAFALGPAIENAADARRLPRTTAAEIRFEGVAVDAALSPFTGTARASERVLIVGPHGSGKSMLLQLASRLVEPDHGRVLVSGRDVSKLTLGSLRRGVAMVSDDLPLLRGSVRMNLCYRHPDASPQQIERVLQLCALDNIIARLPAGLETKLVEGAAPLSPGERRRLSWARALLGDPQVLLVDDVDAGLDEDSRRVFDRVLAGLGGTVLMTAQQADVPIAFDTVWRLPTGPVAATPRIVPAGGDVC